MSAAIPVLRAEPDVEFRRIAPGGFRILAALDHATSVLGRDLVITSGTDSHGAGRHPVGEAFDVRTRDLDVPSIVRLLRVVQDGLGPRFTVLYETPVPPTDPILARFATVNPHATGEHLHAQVRKGTKYPPESEVHT